MEDKYKMLDVLYDIVKDDPHPLHYHCSIREMLLRLQGDWQPACLEELAKDEYILVKPSLTTVVLLTEKGMRKAKEFQRAHVHPSLQ